MAHVILTDNHPATPTKVPQPDAWKTDGDFARVILTDNRSVMPTKALQSDVGYDLTLIDVWKTDGDVTFYETGVIVAPPNGFYFELFPRSSLSKTGYMLANSVGVIDPEYRGTIKVPLMKITKGKPDITLPFKGVQLVLKKVECCDFIKVDMLFDTERSDGGFGSTN